jgi:Na+/proline symporter
MELTELRYGGTPAVALRATRAFLFAVPINCISIGYGMLAMRKVIVALGLLDQLPQLPGDPRLWVLLPIVLVVLVYTAASGLWGVVATDFLQFGLAIGGAVAVAVFALHDVGGLGAMKQALRDSGNGAALDLVPRGADPALPYTTFFGYLFIQWWAFRNSDGGGMFVQRVAATANEAEARKAALGFNILNYVIRTWPWVLVGLVALVVLPGLEDPELAYPMLMVRYLPAGVLGIVFASLLAAFMSTVSTQVNWGASYLVNDLYVRFTGEQDQRRLMRMARLSTIALTVVAAVVSFYMTSVGDVFRFLILIGTGPGIVLLLRWFWWRINAWAEIAAMVTGFVLAVAGYLDVFGTVPFGTLLRITAFGSLAVWLPVMYLTQPERPEVLAAFYRRVRPGGAWAPVRQATGLGPLDDLRRDAGQWLLWTAIILGGTLAVGWLLLR